MIFFIQPSVKFCQISLKTLPYFFKVNNLGFFSILKFFFLHRILSYDVRRFYWQKNSQKNILPFFRRHFDRFDNSNIVSIHWEKKSELSNKNPFQDNSFHITLFIFEISRLSRALFIFKHERADSRKKNCQRWHLKEF